MSASIALAQTTLALCDLLQSSLRRDAGWRLTGSTARVTSLPHGKPDSGSGARLNVGLISVSPAARPDADHATPAPAAYDMRFLVTAHVFSALHSELLIGGALDSLSGNPILPVALPSSAGDDALGRAVLDAAGRDTTTHARLSVAAVDDLVSTDIRLPALIITVLNVVATPDTVPSLLLR